MKRSDLTQRITPPKFKVGNFVLNEYEAREVMARIAEGSLKPDGIIMEDMNGRKATFDSDGIASSQLEGWSVASARTIRKIKAHRLKTINNEKK